MFDQCSDVYLTGGNVNNLFQNLCFCLQGFNLYGQYFQCSKIINSFGLWEPLEIQ